MPRAKTKQELLDSSNDQFQTLLEKVNNLSSAQHTEPGVNGDWSVKDILAHLHAWHELMLTWYREGMAGNKPEMPAPGYTWKTTPDLNQKIYLDYKSMPYDEVMKKLNQSFTEVQKIITNHSDDELFTKKKYAWTGSTSLGSYLVSATASHYMWAIDLIKKWRSSHLDKDIVRAGRSENDKQSREKRA